MLRCNCFPCRCCRPCCPKPCCPPCPEEPYCPSTGESFEINFVTPDYRTILIVAAQGGLFIIPDDLYELYNLYIYEGCDNLVITTQPDGSGRTYSIGDAICVTSSMYLFVQCV